MVWENNFKTGTNTLIVIVYRSVFGKGNNELIDLLGGRQAKIIINEDI